MEELLQSLAVHGQGDHPWIATLTGALDPDHYDEITHRRRPVFRVVAAEDIARSRNVERR
jgi:hypothetical protein